MAKRFYNTFSFTGDLMIPKDADKLVVNHEPFKSGWKKKSLKIGVKVDKSNGTFVNADAMMPPTDSYEVEKIGLDGAKIKFRFSERNDKVVNENVADFVKFVVDLETDFEKKKERIGLQMKIRHLNDRETLSDENTIKLEEYIKELESKSDNLHKFVHELDFIDFLAANIEVLKSHKIRIRGNYTRSTSKGKYYTSYSPTHIELVDDEYTNELKLSVDFYFNKDALDDADFKTDKKINIDGYIESRDGVVKANRYYPQQFVINASKLDMDNPVHVNRLEFIKETFKIKSKNTYHIPVELMIQKGAEQVEFTIDMLEPRHRRQVELGLKKLDDYKPRGGVVYGNNVEEFRFARLLDSDYPDGAEDTEMNFDKEFSDLISTSSSDVTQNEVELKSEIVTPTQSTTVAIDNLFA